MHTEPLTRICGQKPATAGAAIARFTPIGPIGGLLYDAELECELQSSITTDWRVSWSPQECARDLYQNFRDANADALDQIMIATAETFAAISAPAPMDLERAFFLGSTKSKEAGDIGQFGEGLKVSILCLLRDYGADIALVSGDRAVRIGLGEKLPRLQLRPLVYRFFRLAPARRRQGTWLILANTPASVHLALQNAPTDFFHPGHPLLGEVIAGNHDKVLIARTKNNVPGCIFYRNLKRADLSLPLICAVNKPYASMEKLIGRDRDRTAFGENVLTTLYRVIAGSRVIGSRDTLAAFLRATEASWETGHPLISAVLYASYYPGDELSELFGDRYYCDDYRISSLNGNDLIVVRDIEESWKSAGRRCLPGYFRNAGVRSAMDEWEAGKRRTREEAERTLREQRRGPTQAERACIDLLEQFLRDLDSSLADVVLRDVSYLIAETDAILGAWQRSRAYNSREIFLAAKLFCGPLRTAFATLLHEASHLFGTDGSRGFTDSLTNLFERIFGHARRLRFYKKSWAKLRKSVQAERAATVPATSPGVLAATTTADAAFQSLASMPRDIANVAILRYLREKDAGILAGIIREGKGEEALAKHEYAMSCRPSHHRRLPPNTLLREWMGEEPSPLEAALRSGMDREEEPRHRSRRRAASRSPRANVVCHGATRNDGQHKQVLDPQPPQAADKGGSSSHGVLPIGALGTPQPDQSPAVAAQPMSTADVTPSIAATAAGDSTAA
jgi:hypothetical protein